MGSKKIQPIQEVYSCLQGEGRLIGVPHILIRTTGCPLRCQFSDTDFCDSWYTSWHPKKGMFSLEMVEDFLIKNPHIKHTMITGGSPTMHPELLVELVDLCKRWDHYVTIETEGSKFVPTNADLISLSPKFRNSKPRIDTVTPEGKSVIGRDVTRHEKHRKKWGAMGQMLEHHPEFQIKPVISTTGDLSELSELSSLIEYLDQKWVSVKKKDVYLMPAGGTREELDKRRVELIEYCVASGYNYTERLHIVAYNNKIGV